MPLVVGSSATVRSADNQCRNLYGKGRGHLPSSGPQSGRRHLLAQGPTVQQPGRLFVGILPTRNDRQDNLDPGLTRAFWWTGTRFRGASRATPRGDSIRYLYWTIVAYYNSLRELSGAQPMMEDDVPAQMKVYAGAGYSPGPIEKEELTSRRKGFDISSVSPGSRLPSARHRNPPTCCSRLTHYLRWNGCAETLYDGRHGTTQSHG